VSVRVDTIAQLKGQALYSLIVLMCR